MEKKNNYIKDKKFIGDIYYVQLDNNDWIAAGTQKEIVDKLIQKKKSKHRIPLKGQQNLFKSKKK